MIPCPLAGGYQGALFPAAAGGSSRTARWMTTGSVGIPVNGEPTAQYLLLERRRAGWRWEAAFR